MLAFARELCALGRAAALRRTSRPRTSPARIAATFCEDDLDVGAGVPQHLRAVEVRGGARGEAAATRSPITVAAEHHHGGGDSGWTSAFNVLYWPLRALARAVRRDPGAAAAPVDVVSVDYVADAIVHLLDSRDQGVFNLVSGRDAPLANELVELACDRFDRPRPEVKPTGAVPDGDETGAVYLPYFDMDVLFDDSRARATLGEAGISPPRLAEYFDRLIDYAEVVRWGKRSMSREEAREWRADEAEVAAA